jgi:hypothetical protein
MSQISRRTTVAHQSTEDTGHGELSAGAARPGRRCRGEVRPIWCLDQQPSEGFECDIRTCAELAEQVRHPSIGYAGSDLIEHFGRDLADLMGDEVENGQAHHYVMAGSVPVKSDGIPAIQATQEIGGYTTTGQLEHGLSGRVSIWGNPLQDRVHAPMIARAAAPEQGHLSLTRTQV